MFIGSFYLSSSPRVRFPAVITKFRNRGTTNRSIISIRAYYWGIAFSAFSDCFSTTIKVAVAEKRNDFSMAKKKGVELYKSTPFQFI